MEARLRAILEPAKQAHLLDDFASLDPTEQASLYQQITEDFKYLDLSHLNNIFTTSMKDLDPSAQTSRNASIEPPQEADLFMANTPQHSLHAAPLGKLGNVLICSNKGGVIILAGGSGTRLGTTFPKGMLVCPDLHSQKSLFQLHAEKILTRQRLAKGSDASSADPVIQLCLMTSRQTDQETRNFFRQHNFFGLREDQVHFFVQASLPCYSIDGKILKETRGMIATAPGGNGGIYRALADSGLLELLKQKGVKSLQIFTVDNIVANIADPILFGLSEQFDSDVCVKTTEKAFDNEAVGVFAKRDNKWGVVEYTEIGQELAASVDPVSGRRRFNCANIAIHLCTVAFLERAAEIMKTFTWYHAAIKPIPVVGGGKAQGVKLEAFIFDIFQFATNFKIEQVDRQEEFAPVKNADDHSGAKKDTPLTAVRDLHRQHAGWVRAQPSHVRVEISPLIASRVDDVSDELIAAVSVVIAKNAPADAGPASSGAEPPCTVVYVDDSGSVHTCPNWVSKV